MYLLRIQVKRKNGLPLFLLAVDVLIMPAGISPITTCLLVAGDLVEQVIIMADPVLIHLAIANQS